MENSTKSALIKSVVLVLLGAIFILGIYFVLTRGKRGDNSENYKLTVVDEITTTNLDKNYPADPRMVVEFYCKIMQTMYKETYSDEQADQMINVLSGIMDSELLDNQVNFNKSIKDEVTQRKKDDYSMSVYQVQRIGMEGKLDGRNACTVDCYIYLRQGTAGIPAIYQFLLRQDGDGRWKILGWQTKEG